MNLRIITKRFAADPEIGFLTKSIPMPNGHATAMPTAWELRSSEGSHFVSLEKIGYCVNKSLRKWATSRNESFPELSASTIRPVWKFGRHKISNWPIFEESLISRDRFQSDSFTDVTFFKKWLFQVTSFFQSNRILKKNHWDGKKQEDLSNSLVLLGVTPWSHVAQ